MSSVTIGGAGVDEGFMDGRAIIRIGNAAYRNYFYGDAGNLTVTGGGNIGIGAQALHDVAGGGGNVAIGDFALTKQYNLSHSIGIGYQALKNATAASDCIAIGSEALYSMLSGTGTTVIGRLAWNAVSLGGNNTGIGDSIGRYSTSGEGNCVMGYRTFESCNGSFNVALGFAASLARTGGTGNVGVGSGAFGGTGITDLGDYNVAVGFNSGQSLLYGDGNVFIGKYAGNNTAQKSDAENSIAIGMNAYTDSDNQIAIGTDEHEEVVLAGVKFTKAQLVALLGLVSSPA